MSLPLRPYLSKSIHKVTGLFSHTILVVPYSVVAKTLSPPPPRTICILSLDTETLT